MCTVSWARQPGGYHLFCNRDEKRTRGSASAPEIVEQRGVRYVAPADSDFGGTWLAVNEFGVSLSLLNGAPRTEPCVPRSSRGLLIRELSWFASARECMSRLQRLDLAAFPPFTLLALGPSAPAAVAEWDARRLTLDAAADARCPLVSSSYDAAGVSRARRTEFARRAGPETGRDPALLYWFHASHGASASAYSPCMHREDAETVSFSWVVVTPREVRFLYSPAAPCRCAPAEQQILARAA